MAKPGVLRTFLFWGVPLAIALVLLISACIAVYQYLTSSPRFAVQSVEVLTEGPANKQSLIQLAAIAPGANLFDLSLKQIKAKVEKDPWVASASISRALPNRLIIRYVPQVPVAILNLQSMYYVNALGVPFVQVRPGDSLQYPLLQMEAGNVSLDRVKTDQVKLALEVMDLVEKGKVLSSDDISEFTLKNAEDRGGIVLSLTAKFPPKLLRLKYKQKSRLMTLNFGEDDLPHQFYRGERVIKYLADAGKAPKLVRLELGKKVVVKIDQ